MSLLEKNPTVRNAIFFTNKIINMINIMEQFSQSALAGKYINTNVWKQKYVCTYIQMFSYTYTDCLADETSFCFESVEIM